MSSRGPGDSLLTAGLKKYKENGDTSYEDHVNRMRQKQYEDSWLKGLSKEDKEKMLKKRERMLQAIPNQKRPPGEGGYRYVTNR